MSTENEELRDIKIAQVEHERALLNVFEGDDAPDTGSDHVRGQLRQLENGIQGKQIWSDTAVSDSANTTRSRCTLAVPKNPNKRTDFETSSSIIRQHPDRTPTSTSADRPTSSSRATTFSNHFRDNNSPGAYQVRSGRRTERSVSGPLTTLPENYERPEYQPSFHLHSFSEHNEQRTTTPTTMTPNSSTTTAATAATGSTAAPTSSKMPKQTGNKRCYRNVLLGGILLFFLIVVILGVVIGVVILPSQQKSDTANDGGLPSTVQPNGKWKQIHFVCRTTSSEDLIDNEADLFAHLLPAEIERISLFQRTFASKDSATICSPAWMACVATAILLPPSNSSTNRIMQQLALSKFFFSTNGANWKTITNWLSPASSADHCSWHGVSCASDGSEVVTRLDLPDNHVTGELPDDLLMTALKSLDLRNNPIQGTFSSSRFAAATPNLMRLNLNQTRIKIVLSSDIGLLTSLTSLYLGDYYYLTSSSSEDSSTLTTEIGMLTNLRELGLTMTMRGSFPGKEVLSLPLLERLKITAERPLPASDPSFPENVFVNNTGWREIHMSNVQFSNGGIPTTIGNLKELEAFAVDSAFSSGIIPTEIGRCTSLQLLALRSSGLTGTLPTELGLCTSLTGLQIYRARFSSVSIPSELGNLGQLRELVLSESHLVGTLPTELGRLTNLERLDVMKNQLETATIPSDFTRLQKLTDLSLSCNHWSFDGTIPAMMLSQLTSLVNLKINSKCGGLRDEICEGPTTIPPELCENNSSFTIQVSCGSNVVVNSCPCCVCEIHRGSTCKYALGT